MQIRIIAVGKLRESWIVCGAAEYLKRLTAYATVCTTELPDVRVPDRPSPAQIRAAVTAESLSILRVLKDREYLIALDMRGKQLDSPGLATLLNDAFLRGRSGIAVAVGGSHGLSAELISRADAVLSMSKLTFPHQLARLIFLEQLYRAFRILKNEPYHK